jgi:hypothetical protein
MDMMKLCDLLIGKIKRDYPEDVSLVHIHGSYAYGDTHDRSDLDLYFVPKTERGYNLGCTFILDGIGCDLWALSWERLERIANHEEKITSIITDGKVVYYGSGEDKTRFDGLIAKTQGIESGATQGIESSAKPAQSAASKLAPAYKAWFRMQRAGSIAEARASAIDMAYTISFALSELNGIAIKRGRRLLKQEILAMPHVPQDFGELYDTAFTSGNINAIKMSYGRLLGNTELLIAEQKNLGTGKVPFERAFDGWYEEMIQSYNKICHACEIGDIYNPLFAAVEYSSELQSMFERIGIEPLLPDMVAAFDPHDLSRIARAAREHQDGFERLLSENGMEPRRFGSFEEVEAYLGTL